MQIMLIDESGNKMGNNFTLTKAQNIAKSRGLDLILVNEHSNFAVYKLGDKGKLSYEQKQKDKKKRIRQKAQKIKEIQIRPTTDIGDLDIKTRKIAEFLAEGLKTKLVMKFKKSQLGCKDMGMIKVQSLVNRLVADGIATGDCVPKFDGNNISVFLSPSVK